ncbi:MAG: oligosaccharide flippase family protein [Mariprofundales bacterium]
MVPLIASRILTNTVYNAAGRVWLIVINLFLTPLILSYLGDQRFALWALFWSLQSWVTFSDLGIGVSVVKEVARLMVDDDHDGVNSTVCTGLTFNAIVITIIAGTAWLAADLLVHYMHVGNGLFADAVAIAHIGPLVFVVLALITIFDCLLRGLQQYDKINMVAIVVSVVNAAGVWIALRYGYGIEGLLVAVVVVYTTQLLLLMLVAKRVFPQLSIHWRYVRVKKLWQMLPFGLHLQAGRLAELASYQADKFILVLLTPLYFVTTYDLASKVATLIRQLPYLLTSAIFPAIAQLHADQDYHRLWLAYERGSKYLWMVSTPLFFGLCITAHLIILLWLGHVSSEVHDAVLLLGLGYWSIVNVSMATSIGTGMGWSKPVMYSSLLQAVANIALSWLLASRLGYVGVLYATTITLAATSMLLLYWFYRDFSRSGWVDLKVFIMVLLANLPPSLLALLYLYLGGYDHFMEHRLDAAIPLLLCILLYGVSYIVSLKVLRLLDRTDADWLKPYLPSWLYRYLL